MHKVLLIDDDPGVRGVLRMMLQSLNVQVIEAANGVAGLSIFRKHKPHLVITDIMMPEKDGLAAMREIRAQRHLQDLPIIALTAKAMKGDREKCLEAGASDYLAKPVNTEQLLSALRMWLHR